MPLPCLTLLYKIKLTALFAFGPHSVMLRSYSWFSAQRFFLVALGVPYRMLGMKPRLALCKVRTLPAVPYLSSPLILFLFLI